MSEKFEGNTEFTQMQDPMDFFRMMKKSRDESWEKMLHHLVNDRGMKMVDIGGKDARSKDTEEEKQQAPRILLYPPHPGEKRGALIICAGGAFVFKSWNEAEPVADYFYEQGFYTVILDYRVQPYTQKDSAADGHRAIRYLRAHAEELNVDPEHVAIGGFSAGGMLSNLAASTYPPADMDSADELEHYSARPDAAILGYGAFVEAAGVGKLGFDFRAQNELARNAPELLLHPDCPPYFMFQTTADDPRNVAIMSLRLAELGIPFEAHTFQGGMHGNGLFNGKNEVENVPHTAHWAELCTEWLEQNGFERR